MHKSTYHSHSHFCDGKDEPESYVKEAINRGFSSFGFSSHAPVNFDTTWNMKKEKLPEYVRLTQALKEKYMDDLDLHTGLETDYYEGCTDWRNFPGIEYTIGAVHFIYDRQTNSYLPVDGNAQEVKDAIALGFDGDSQAFVEADYALIREMLLTMPPSVLAHMDVVRKNNQNNRLFDEEAEWYRDEIIKTLDIVSLTDVVVEVNTGGISRGYVKNPYPSRFILELCHEMHIPIMLNSDTHHPDTIDFGYSAALELLASIGIKTQRVLLNGIWQDVELY